MITTIARFVLLALTLALYAQPLFAQPVTAAVTITFTPGSIGTAVVEHVAETKNPDGTWQQRAVGPNSPLAFSLSGQPGDLVTARVRTRIKAQPAVVSAPSNETSAYIPPGSPGVIAMSIVTAGSPPAPITPTPTS